MTLEDSLTRGTAWLALLLYVGQQALQRMGANASGKAWWLGASGCASLLIHILLSFHFRHDWSHAAAYADTARQTAALTGWNSGGGIFVNYLFALVWMLDVGSSWSKRKSANQGSTGRIWMLRAFFLFMFLNAAVIFVRSPARWLGLACCLGLIGLWLWPRKHSIPYKDETLFQL